MTNSLATKAVPTKATEGKKNRGPLDRISVEPADNGYMATSHFMPKGKGEQMSYPEPERKVFGNHVTAAAHVAQAMAANCPGCEACSGGGRPMKTAA